MNLNENPIFQIYFLTRKIDFIINIPSTSTIEKYVGMLYDEYLIRRKAVEMGIPVLTTVESCYFICQNIKLDPK